MGWFNGTEIPAGRCCHIHKSGSIACTLAEGHGGPHQNQFACGWKPWLDIDGVYSRTKEDWEKLSSGAVTTSKSLLATIDDTWASALRSSDGPGGTIDAAAEAEARALEEQLSRRIEPQLDQFEDGNISASEFVTNIIFLASSVPD